MIAYKLLNRDLTTYNSTQWIVGHKQITNGEGLLCGPGWLHAYLYPELAYFLNPLHANFTDPILYEVEVGGQQLDGLDLKSGWTEMTLLRPYSRIQPPTLEQRIRCAIRCAMSVYTDPSYTQWATDWITQVNRSFAAAYAAANAAYSAAYSATDAAADAAANAARATTYAAQTMTACTTTDAAQTMTAYAAAYDYYEDLVAYSAAQAVLYTALYSTALYAKHDDLRSYAVWAYSDSTDLQSPL